jgi:hypothetical protein
MTIRIDKNENYTTIANFALNDPNLSLKAKGLWAFLMSKPNDWKISYRGLMSQLKEGQSAILSAMKELEKEGYLVRGEKFRMPGGTFKQDDSILFEKPCVENLSADSSRTKVNTDKVNTDKYINDTFKTNKNGSTNKPLLQKLIEIINPNEKITPSRLNHLSGRLNDGYMPEELIGAAKEFAKSDWHMKYGQMSIDNLLAPSKIGRWHNQAVKPKKKVIF